MAIYKFILTPLDTIFFGDEKSPFKQEYFQLSRYMPQQTGVLGFLRFEVLRRANKIGKDFGDWTGLIGEKSFNGNTQTFGVIKKIGPVGIAVKGTGKVLYPLKDPVNLESDEINALVDFGEGTNGWNKLTLFQNATSSERYDSKDYRYFSIVFSDYIGVYKYAESETDEKFLKKHGYKRPNLDDRGIFWKDLRPGITKNYGGVSGEEGYYKTQFLRMMPGYAYTFNAEIDEHILLKNEKWKETSIVRFGGDRSVYRVEVKEDNWSPDGDGNVFVLKSDTLVNNTIYNYCSSVVSDVRHFRNIRTQNYSDAKEYYNKRPGMKNNPNGQFLLSSGSILIAKNDTSAMALAEALQTEKAYTNIGYNQFKRLSLLPKGTLS